MREIAIVSGKGGTGKTTLAASFAVLARPVVVADCDVDAADLFLLMDPREEAKGEFRAGRKPVILPDRCTSCGICVERCRFRALSLGPEGLRLDRFACEGCGLCARVCPSGAIEMREQVCGEWYVSAGRCGPMAHARLHVAEENSGKLVTLVREKARGLARERGLDTIIIDGPPGIGCPVISSITNTDLAVVVTEPTLSGLHDLERIAGLARQLRVRTAVCVNKCDLNEDVSVRLGEYCAANGIPLAGRIPYDRAVVESLVRGEPLVCGPPSAAGAAVREAWERLLGETAAAREAR